MGEADDSRRTDVTSDPTEHLVADSTVCRTSVDIVIITYCRPENVRIGLEHLSRQRLAPAQVLVVDSSPDARTAEVVSHFPFATYIANPAGYKNMTSSRNEAIQYLRSTVTAFLDDDAYPDRAYIAELTAFYDAHPEVSLGCCRTLNGVPGEEDVPLEGIGKLSRGGRIIGNFAADPGQDLAVDHGIGATMHMRTDLILELGGFREYYTGVSGVREDSDVFMRARTLGHQAWFIHRAVALHVAAPQSKGKRFDLRYKHWSARNHAILMMANRGMLTAGFWASVWTLVVQSAVQRGPVYKRLARFTAVASGATRGVIVALTIFGPGPRPASGGYRKRNRTLSLPSSAGRGPSSPAN